MLAGGTEGPEAPHAACSFPLSAGMAGWPQAAWGHRERVTRPPFHREDDRHLLDLTMYHTLPESRDDLSMPTLRPPFQSSKTKPKVKESISTTFHRRNSSIIKMMDEGHGHFPAVAYCLLHLETPARTHFNVSHGGVLSAPTSPPSMGS